MSAELQRIFESIPKDTPRSRLEPYRELILRWRRQGRTYRRIKTLLADRCSIQVSTTMLFKFVKSRSRPRKAEPEAKPQLIALDPTPPDRIAPQQAVQQAIKLSPEEVARQRALIQALRNKPVVVPEVRKRFVYDPDEPLILDRTTKD